MNNDSLGYIWQDKLYTTLYHSRHVQSFCRQFLFYGSQHVTQASDNTRV